MMQSVAVLVKSVTYDAARSGIASYSEAGASRTQCGVAQADPA